jgi:hypothetical protein
MGAGRFEKLNDLHPLVEDWLLKSGAGFGVEELKVDYSNTWRSLPVRLGKPLICAYEFVSEI